MLRYDAALILLYNKNKKVLVQKRVLSEERHPGMWGCFGGGIDEGENPDISVVRECKEELGYKLQNPEFVFEKKIKSGDSLFVFIEEYDEKHLLVLNTQEADEMRWVDINELRELDMIEHDRDIAIEICKLLNQRK